MKKIGKFIVFGLIVFLLNMTNSFAREVNLNELGDLIVSRNPSADAFYVIGKYAFTMNYVRENNLNTEDFMLAARSITVLESDGKTKGTPAYVKMSAYQISSNTDEDGNVVDWYVGKNLIGTNTITNDIIFDIEYIDYKEVKNLHTVEFNTNEGNTIPALKVEEGSTIAELPTPEKEGYDFVYWYKDDEGTEFKAEENPINEDITLNAKWKEKKYTITFDDENVTSDKEVTYTYPNVKPNDKSDFAPSEKEGYTFDYWYDEEVGEDTEFNFNEDLTKDVTLKAKWNANVYTITFDDENVDDDDKEVSYTYPEVTPSNKKEFKPNDKKGYTFAYWYDETAGEETQFNFDTPISKDITLKAKWNANVYTITFDDENVDDDDKEVSYTYPEVTPSNKKGFTPSEKEGYTFDYWYDEAVGEETQFNFDEELTQSVTLKAKWNANVYTITFDDENVDTDNKTANYTYPEVTPSDKKDFKPNEKEGYTFAYWYDETAGEETQFNFDNPINKDIKLKAKWNANVYTITFDDENVDAENKTASYTYPEVTPSDKKDFKPNHNEGFDFAYWYNVEDGENTPFNFEAPINKNITLKARWDVATLTITFKNDDKTDYEVKEIKYNDNIEKPNDPEKDSEVLHNGYEFNSWHKCNDKDCNTYESEAFNFDVNGKQVKEDIVLIAVYDTVVYTNQIISDFVEDVESDDFTAYMVEDAKIQFNIVNQNIPLATNFNKFVEGIKAIVNVANVKNVVIDYNETSKTLTKSSDINGDFKEIFAALTRKTFESSEIIDLDNATFKLTINLEDGYKNLEGNSNDPYVVTIDAENFETVNNESELIDALKGTKEIIFANDITINKELVIDKDIAIDGKNYTLISNINDAKYALNIKNGNAVIKDLKIKIGTLLPSEYDKANKTALKVKNTIGAYVGSGVSLTVTNVNVISDVKLDATNLKMGEEDLHAYNVPINENAAIELHGKLYGSQLTYQNEIYGSPIVLVAVDGTMDLARLHKTDKVYNITRKELSDNSEAVEKFAHYYADRSHTDIIHVLHMPNDREFVSLFYIPNEKFVVPTAFTEGHKKYTYSENGKNYVFDNKFAYYKNSKRTEITVEELQKLIVSNTDIRILTAIYREVSE